MYLPEKRNQVQIHEIPLFVINREMLEFQLTF